MAKKGIYVRLAVIFLVIGSAFLIDIKTKIVGAVIAVPEGYSFILNLIIGLALLLTAGLFFIIAKKLMD